jgi:ectoine hydroxylase-related dioxygenase (phytanoyl-CoA dioxygenase family)
VQVSQQQLLDEGYIILRGMILPEELKSLRVTVETLYERQPKDEGWSKRALPRVIVDELIDEETANVVDFVLGENTLGVSHQLLGKAEVAPSMISILCNPVFDAGPSRWHRDIHPHDQAPLAGIQLDFLANGPGYVQWNIPLYDDDVLWVVPGSHRQLNTEEENRHLAQDPRLPSAGRTPVRVPLPGSIPVELKAGDGVVYINTILHWGSNYSTKMRRTLHLGYRSFQGAHLPYGAVESLASSEPSFPKYLSPTGQAMFAHFAQLRQQEQALLVSALRTILRRDATAFHEALVALHPGEKGRLVCVVLLAKLVQAILVHLDSSVLDEVDAQPPGASGRRLAADIGSLGFSLAEAESLWQRFAALESKLKSPYEGCEPGFQSGPMRYFFNQMPSDFDVESFIAGWA